MHSGRFWLKTIVTLSEYHIVILSDCHIVRLSYCHIPQHPKYWMSLVWAGAVVTRAKKEGRISDQFAFQTIITEINKFRSGCGGLLDYDWISVPLVYTQVCFFQTGICVPCYDYLLTRWSPWQCTPSLSPP